MFLGVRVPTAGKGEFDWLVFADKLDGSLCTLLIWLTNLGIAADELYDNYENSNRRSRSVEEV